MDMAEDLRFIIKYTVLSLLAQKTSWLSANICQALLVDIHYCIFAAAKTYLLRMLDGMDTMLFVDAVEQVGRIVLSRHLLLASY